MSETVIVDYGAGNLASVRNAFAALGADTRIARTPEEIETAERLVLPGVGAAGTAMERLRALGLDQALTDRVRKQGRPMFGICLGMQLVADTLYEYGEHKGLGWIRGEVVALGDAGVTGTIPHMGWNDVVPEGPARALFDAVPPRKRQFYFSHSYTLRVDDARLVAARTDYDRHLISAVLDETVFAVQFHPEKSQQSGRLLLRAFLDWNP